MEKQNNKAPKQKFKPSKLKGVALQAEQKAKIANAAQEPNPEIYGYGR